MLIAIGTNHKYSPIELREKLAFSRKNLENALIFLKELTDFKGAVILSTCNRVEVYTSCEDGDHQSSKIEDFLSTYHEVRKERIAPYLYRYIGKDALRHLFEVACGLDSQVLGETQVLGQVKFFYEEAKGLGYTDDILDSAYSAAIEIGRLVRIETQISKGNVSIGSAAINLIKKEIKDLSKKKILIIGVGKISSLVIKYLSKEGVESIFVSNRTYERALALAESVGAKVVRFDRLKENLKDADIVISATSSPHLILRKDDILQTMNDELANSRTHELLIIDLALPRDVDPNVRDIEGVKLFDLDDLNSVIEENLTKRRFEAERARLIVNNQADTLWRKFIELEREPARLR